MQAAAYWTALCDVIDTSATHPAELSKNCSSLLAFGDQGRVGVVNLCTIAAQNFLLENTQKDGNTAENGGNDALTVRENVRFPRNKEEDFDRNHYHGGAVLTVRDAEEGRKACFACLLRCIAVVKECKFVGVMGSAVQQV